MCMNRVVLVAGLYRYMQKNLTTKSYMSRGGYRVVWLKEHWTNSDSSRHRPTALLEMVEEKSSFQPTHSHSSVIVSVIYLTPHQQLKKVNVNAACG